MNKKTFKKKYVSPQAISFSDYGVAYGGPCTTGGSASACTIGNTASNNCATGNSAVQRCGIGEGAGNCGTGNTPI